MTAATEKEVSCLVCVHRKRCVELKGLFKCPYIPESEEKNE